MVIFDYPILFSLFQIFYFFLKNTPFFQKIKNILFLFLNFLFYKIFIFFNNKKKFLNNQ